jgi:6-phosphogluconolactonase (cycloisomerase 2 family)
VVDKLLTRYLQADQSVLIVSNRNDSTFGISPSIDSLASFTISPTDGTLTKRPLVSAQGSYPRQFALNRDGDLLAVGLQKSGTLVVLQKNPNTGLFDREAASIKFNPGLDAPACVVWNE